MEPMINEGNRFLGLSEKKIFFEPPLRVRQPLKNFFRPPQTIPTKVVLTLGVQKKTEIFFCQGAGFSRHLSKNMDPQTTNRIFFSNTGFGAQTRSFTLFAGLKTCSANRPYRSSRGKRGYPKKKKNFFIRGHKFKKDPLL